MYIYSKTKNYYKKNKKDIIKNEHLKKIKKKGKKNSFSNSKNCSPKRVGIIRGLLHSYS